jgi:hypothetical protein
VLSGLISFSAAECITTYLIGGYMTDVLGVPHRYNAPPIALNAILLVLLWWKARATEQKASLAGTP